LITNKEEEPPEPLRLVTIPEESNEDHTFTVQLASNRMMHDQSVDASVELDFQIKPQT
jgi:hypothetical protein